MLATISRVLTFDYTGIVLSVAVLEFYARDFLEITSSGLPQNIAHVFKSFVVEKIQTLRVIDGDDRPEGLMVSNPWSGRLSGKKEET